MAKFAVGSTVVTNVAGKQLTAILLPGERAKPFRVSRPPLLLKRCEPLAQGIDVGVLLLDNTLLALAMGRQGVAAASVVGSPRGLLP
jgi:hypothetical protein